MLATAADADAAATLASFILLKRSIIVIAGLSLGAGLAMGMDLIIVIGADRGAAVGSVDEDT